MECPTAQALLKNFSGRDGMRPCRRQASFAGGYNAYHSFVILASSDNLSRALNSPGMTARSTGPPGDCSNILYRGFTANLSPVRFWRRDSHRTSAPRPSDIDEAQTRVNHEPENLSPKYYSLVENVRSDKGNIGFENQIGDIRDGRLSPVKCSLRCNAQANNRLS